MITKYVLGCVISRGSSCVMYFCFFSRRRRHTRYWSDWSSDVCSSDLVWRGSDDGFFSSRRRHTRYWRDWSSDVCSSDLRGWQPDAGLAGGAGAPGGDWRGGVLFDGPPRPERAQARRGGAPAPDARGGPPGEEIGRASCRERVKISLVAVSLTKTYSRSTT